MPSTPGFAEPGPHWWEASALTTAPPLLPEEGGGWGWLGGTAAHVMVDFKPKENMGMMFIQAVTQATKSISQFSQHLYALIC